MRVLFVSSSSGSRGGGELYLLLLSRALVKCGVTVGLWASKHPRMDELCEQFAHHGEVLRDEYTNTYDRRLRVFGIRQPNMKQIVEHWRSWHPQILHVNKQNLEDGLDLLEAANFFGSRAACTIHITQQAAFLGARLSGLRDWWSIRCLTTFRGQFVVVEEARKEELRQLVGEKAAIEAVPNGVRIPSSHELSKLRQQKRTELGLSNNGMFIIAVGRLWEQKRPFLFFDWALKLREAGIGEQFRWIGEGHLESEWDQKAAELGPWIRRIGWQRDVLPYLAAADLFLHPARYEGLPFAVLEAMATGLPCVLSEEVCQGSFAKMPRQSFIKAAPGWEERIRTDSLLNRTGEKARAAVEDEYSVEVMADRYMKLYHRMGT